MSSQAQPEVVLITGANQGLGYFTALQLSKLFGYHVLVGSRDAKKGTDAVNQIKAEGPVSTVSPIVIDVDSDESIRSARAEVERRWGKLDVLVVSPARSFCLALHVWSVQNNAAVNFEFVEGRHPGLSTRELLTQTYNTNVFGLAVATEEFVPLLEKAPFPRVVNLSSPLASLTNMSNPEVPHSAFRQLAYLVLFLKVNSFTHNLSTGLQRHENRDQRADDPFRWRAESTFAQDSSYRS
jgi:NAD(P)-dependent dehydrogenase (short-subunit alcohol dehydrogenase family)